MRLGVILAVVWVASVWMFFLSRDTPETVEALAKTINQKVPLVNNRPFLVEKATTYQWYTGAVAITLPFFFLMLAGMEKQKKIRLQNTLVRNQDDIDSAQRVLKTLAALSSKLSRIASGKEKTSLSVLIETLETETAGVAERFDALHLKPGEETQLEQQLERIGEAIEASVVRCVTVAEEHLPLQTKYNAVHQKLVALDATVKELEARKPASQIAGAEKTATELEKRITTLEELKTRILQLQTQTAALKTRYYAADGDESREFSNLVLRVKDEIEMVKGWCEKSLESVSTDQVDKWERRRDGISERVALLERLNPRLIVISESIPGLKDRYRLANGDKYRTMDEQVKQTEKELTELREMVGSMDIPAFTEQAGRFDQTLAELKPRMDEIEVQNTRLLDIAKQVDEWEAALATDQPDRQELEGRVKKVLQTLTSAATVT